MTAPLSQHIAAEHISKLRALCVKARNSQLGASLLLHAMDPVGELQRS